MNFHISKMVHKIFYFSGDFFVSHIQFFCKFSLYVAQKNWRLTHWFCVAFLMGIAEHLLGCQSVNVNKYQATTLPVRQAVGIGLSSHQAQMAAQTQASQLCHSKQAVIIKQQVYQSAVSNPKKSGIFEQVGNVVGNIFGQTSYRQVALPEYRVRVTFECR